MFVILVRRPILSSLKSSPTACPGIGRRIGDYPNIKPLVPVRYHTNNDSRTPVLLTQIDINIQKDNKFKQIIEQSNVDLSTNDYFRFHYEEFHLDELRKASWNGIPKQYRAKAWKFLCVRSID